MSDDLPLARRTRITIPLRFAIDEAGAREMAEDVMDELRSRPEFGSWTVSFKAPHASWIEYGTPPSDRHLSADGRQRVEMWARGKLNGVNGHAASAVAKAVDRRRMTEGYPPRPFLRPAVYEARRLVAENPDLLEGGEVSMLMTQALSQASDGQAATEPCAVSPLGVAALAGHLARTYLSEDCLDVDATGVLSDSLRILPAADAPASPTLPSLTAEDGRRPDDGWWTAMMRAGFDPAGME